MEGDSVRLEAMRDLFISSSSDANKKSNEKRDAMYIKTLLLGLSSMEGIGWKTTRHIFRAYIKEGDEVFSLKRLADLLHRNKTPNYKELASKIASDLERIKEIGFEEYGRLRNEDIDFLIEWELPSFVRNVNGEKPYWLFVKGNKDLLFSKESLPIGIVGTRKPSQEAKDYIKKIVWLFSHYPVIIASGLAEGIDFWVHDISINLGMKNVAFLGHGIYVSTSKASKELKKRIIDTGGVVVSEYFPKERYNKDKFLRRNRLIASFSEIVIPIQANVPGGTYSTVLHALKKNKHVIGVDMKNSSIVNFLREKGCHILNISKESDFIFLDKFIRNLLKEKDIKFDVLATFKEKIKELVERELSYRHKDKEFYREMKIFLMELQKQIDKGMEDKHVDQRDDYPS